MARAAFLLTCLLGLSGCGLMTATFVGANMATVIHAKKTIPDLVVSEQRGKNCSLVHLSRNEAYCQSAPPDPTKVLAALSDNRYCYRTLGRIDCYDRPDFLASGQTRVNFATGFLPADQEPAPMAQRQAEGVPMAGIPAPAEAILGPRATAPAAVMSPKDPSPAAKSGAKSASGAKHPGKHAKGAPAAIAPPAPAAKAPGKDVPVQKDTTAMAPPAAPPALIDPRLTGIPVAQVPPLAALPGQGTY